MIVSSRVTDLSPERSGRFRARFEFTLSDGRIIQSGPINVASVEDAESMLDSLGESMLLSVQRADAMQAVSDNVQVAYMLATLEQVQYAWLKTGFNEEEHYEAYNKMKDVGPVLLALDLTDQEYAELLGSTLEDAVAVREYWAFLDSNSVVIESYRGIL